MNVRETKVRLSEDARRRIVALVGAQRMATFIREAVEAELVRREASSKPSENASAPCAKMARRRRST